jgi:xylulokinase
MDCDTPKKQPTANSVWYRQRLRVMGCLRKAMYLGIDCGTQGTKALLMDNAGTALGRGYAAHRLVERTNGAREQEPSWWVDALKVAVRQACGDTGSQVRALGVSGQQHGLVVLDESHRVIRPAKLWNDTETAAQNQALLDAFGGKRGWFERFGIVPLTGYTISKLLWIKQREPESFARIRHMLLPHEYLNFYLTGEMCAEAGDASGTGFFDVRTRSWIREVLDWIDEGEGLLYRALPRLIAVDEMVGTVRPEIAAELGIPATCRVACGGGDNMMGAIGTGNVQEGVVTLSLGTSSTVYCFQSSPAHDPTGCVAPFCSSTGGWLPLVCTMNATNVVTQMLDTLGLGVEAIEGALAETSAGADGLVCLPFLNGERTPDLPLATGTLSGMTASNLTRTHLIRAMVEGVSFGILNGLDLMVGGKPVRRILAIGGGARSRAWRQLLADATGAEVVTPVESEAGCLGAAIQAIYLDAHLERRPETFAEIVQRCVKTDEASGAVPNGELRAAYDRARGRYARELAGHYGVSM